MSLHRLVGQFTTPAALSDTVASCTANPVRVVGRELFHSSSLASSYLVSSIGGDCACFFRKFLLVVARARSRRACNEQA